MDYNRIDRAIDDAAREMIAGEPSAAFRPRVMDRLDERRARLRWPRVLAPIAIAAAVVCAVIASRGLKPPALTNSATDGRAVLNARGIPFISSVTGHEPVAIEPPRIAGRATAHPLGESVVAALAPSRLQIPSLMISPLDRGESLQVPALEPIEPITLSPIGEPQGEPR